MNKGIADFKTIYYTTILYCLRKTINLNNTLYELPLGSNNRATLSICFLEILLVSLKIMMSGNHIYIFFKIFQQFQRKVVVW